MLYTFYFYLGVSIQQIVCNIPKFIRSFEEQFYLFISYSDSKLGMVMYVWL